MRLKYVLQYNRKVNGIHKANVKHKSLIMLN